MSKRYLSLLIFFLILLIVSILPLSGLKIAYPLNTSVTKFRPQSPEQEFEFGTIFAYGIAVPKDFMAAEFWYLQSANKDFVLAMRGLGDLIVTKAKTREDYSLPIYWYEMAALKGDAVSQYKMGRFMAENLPGSDRNTALHWFQLAANQHYPPALYELGRIAEEDLNYTQAIRFYSKSADLGYSGAILALSDMYRFGRTSPPNRTMSLSLLKKAADSGSAIAQFNLANTYNFSSTDNSDFLKAGFYYVEAASQGLAPAKFIVEENRKKCASDDTKIIKSCLLSAYSGDPHVQFIIGQLYGSGDFLPYNSELASCWISTAAFNGNGAARAVFLRDKLFARTDNNVLLNSYIWSIVFDKLDKGRLKEIVESPIDIKKSIPKPSKFHQLVAQLKAYSYLSHLSYSKQGCYKGSPGTISAR